ncbi:MAG: MBL fold metallo-hydrolase [SAR202 cluster bacterium]|nr:MBL fold metallo-hydrolase [SAR202 cluster bacterium]MDP6512524.1 MBL fold metallo-hydrolase [SAR202 cluster bacterium]MDP6716499.1 MBL fold metallo-hydrolase [SAR202 cluster bacterium]
MTTVSLEPVDSVTITTLMDNSSDMLLLDQGPAKRPSLTGGPERVAARFLDTGEVGDALIAEHGFSALITVTRGDDTHRILFDAGISPNGVVENMRRLDMSPKDIEAMVISHGHFDHTVGLDGLSVSLGGSAKMPVMIHPEFWSRRRIAIPGRSPSELPSTSKSALIGAGFEVIEERQPSFLLDSSILVTGEVDRTTEFETGFPVHEAFHDEGGWQPDPLILDDQALVMNVRDKGLVVLTGCGHAGIVNIVRYAKKLTGVENVYAVLGGYHLNGPIFEPIIQATTQALAAYEPQYIVPAHCTGFRAVHALAAAMPDAFIQNSVGTRFEF